jgi:hypothetical protein
MVGKGVGMKAGLSPFVCSRLVSHIKIKKTPITQITIIYYKNNKMTL